MRLAESRVECTVWMIHRQCSAAVLQVQGQQNTNGEFRDVCQLFLLPKAEVFQGDTSLRISTDDIPQQVSMYYIKIGEDCLPRPVKN